MWHIQYTCGAYLGASVGVCGACRSVYGAFGCVCGVAHVCGVVGVCVVGMCVVGGSCVAHPVHVWFVLGASIDVCGACGSVYGAFGCVWCDACVGACVWCGACVVHACVYMNNISVHDSKQMLWLIQYL